MISIPPKNLQNALIFYITCIIIFTSGFFAVVTLSRENLLFYQEALNRSVFLGNILNEPVLEFLQGKSGAPLERVLSNREALLEGMKITIYDRKWWQKCGDPARIPPEGFPVEMPKGVIQFRSGIPGESVREIFLGVYSGADWLGTIGLGIPESTSTKKVIFSLHQVVLTTITNILLGIALAIFIAQIILRPLNTLLEGIEALKRGDYGQRVHVQGEGELAVLGQMFNRMAASLQETIHDSQDRNRMLDEKVQELWEIFELTKAMGFSLHLQQILERFMEKALTLSFSSYGQILLHVPESGRVEARVETPAFPLISREDYERNLSKCLSKGETCEVKTGKHTLLYIPLLSGRLVQGILFLGKQGDKSYSDSIRRFLETIAPLGGSMMENARLYQHVVEMKDYVRNVLDSVESGVATVDCDGRVVTANKAFRQTFSECQEPMEKKLLSDMLAQFQDRTFAKNLEKIALGWVSRASPTSSSFGLRQECVYQNHLGEQKILQLRSGRLMGAGNVIGRVLVTDDLTSLKQIERRMFDAEKWVVLGRLAASVAHEIRNPLVAIRSLVEIIGEDLTGENAEHVKVVIGEVHRLNKVVEQLLHLSRPERTELRDTSLNTLLDELIVLVRHEASRANVQIKKEWPPEPIYGKIDPEKIKQAFLNVMLNAFQSMFHGGTLTISLACLSVSVNEEGLQENILQVDFTDEGEGIPKENTSRLFDPFFTTRTHGTGLGLAITKKILDLHNGRIEISSTVGKGTRVRMILPQNPADDHQEQIS